MALPVKPLPTSEVDGIAIRSLTFREATQFQKLGGDLLEASVFLLVTATGNTNEEVDAWIDATDFADVQRVVAAVLDLSGLSEGEEAGEPIDPKSGGNEPS